MKIDFISLYNESRCNLECVYCYTHQRRRRPNRLTPEISRELIEQAKSLGAGRVLLSGPGEATISKANRRLIEYIYNAGMRTDIFTNGLLLDEELLQFLSATETRIEMKLHSFNKEVYDELAGKRTQFAWKAFSFTYKGEQHQCQIPEFLHRLIQMDYAGRDKRMLRLQIAITRKNIDDVLLLAKLATALDINTLVETLVESPNVRRIQNELMPSPEQMKYVKKQLVDIFGEIFEKKQANLSCGMNKNPVVFEDGTISCCLIKPTPISWFEERSLEKAFARVLASVKVPVFEIRNGFKSCFGREYIIADQNKGQT